jgi:hypothetical protein
MSGNKVISRKYQLLSRVIPQSTVDIRWALTFFEVDEFPISGEKHAITLEFQAMGWAVTKPQWSLPFAPLRHHRLQRREVRSRQPESESHGLRGLQANPIQ